MKNKKAVYEKILTAFCLPDEHDSFLTKPFTAQGMVFASFAAAMIGVPYFPNNYVINEKYVNYVSFFNDSMNDVKEEHKEDTVFLNYNLKMDIDTIKQELDKVPLIKGRKTYTPEKRITPDESLGFEDNCYLLLKSFPINPKILAKVCWAAKLLGEKNIILKNIYTKKPVPFVVEGQKMNYTTFHEFVFEFAECRVKAGGSYIFSNVTKLEIKDSLKIAANLFPTLEETPYLKKHFKRCEILKTARERFLILKKT